MPELIKQPTAMPTRKMFAVALSGAITAGIIKGINSLVETSPTWDFIATSEFQAFVPIGVAVAVGYMLKDFKK